MYRGLLRQDGEDCSRMVWLYDIPEHFTANERIEQYSNTESARGRDSVGSV